PAGRISEFDPTVANPGAGGRLGAMVFGRSSLAGTYGKAFAPRLGFAFELTSRTVVRGGYGIYYGFAPASVTIDGIPREGYTYIQDVSTNNLGITPAFNINNGFPALNVTLPQLDPSLKNGSTVIYVDPSSMHPPVSQQWSLGVQRELPGRTLLDVAYVGNKGTHLAGQLLNRNQVDPRYLSLGPLLNQNITSAAAVQAGIAKPYPSFAGTVSQALRPYPQYTGITDQFQTDGSSWFQSLQVKFDKRFSNGLMFLNAYTLSKLIDTGGRFRGSNDPLVMDTTRPYLEKTLSEYDHTHTFVTSWVYELPVGRGHRLLSSNKIAANLLGNWRAAASVRYYTSAPLGITSSQSLPLFGGPNRPNRILGVPILVSNAHF